MKTTRSQRGFTLVELLVGLAVTSIVLVAVAGGTIAIQHVYERESVIKGSVEGARLSEQLIERLVHMAGYGLPPETGFDFAPPGGTLLKDNDNVRPKILTDPERPQDVVSDDLAWRYRDPTYLRRGAVVSGTLTLTTGTFGVPLKGNQAVMVACPGGIDYAVFRTSGGVAASANSVVVTPYGAPFTNSTAACLSQTSGAAVPYVMLVIERRMRVRTLGTGLRPYLVLYRNLEDPTTNSDFEPIATDVENFQVTYTMNRPIAGATVPAGAVNNFGNNNWILCDTGDGDCNVASAATRAYPMPTDPAPRYEDSYTHANRFNRNPANIRAVNVFATIRSNRQDPTARRGLFKPQALGNFIYVTPIDDNFFRADFSTSVRVPNMLSRSFFVPPLSTTPGDRLNKWGG